MVLVLIIGLLVFLSAHSLKLVAPQWRQEQIGRLGEKRWKGLVGVVSLAGFLTIIEGVGLARSAPQDLWAAPTWTVHLTALLTLAAFLLVTAAYVPGNRLKASLGHPMLLGVTLWALGHLIANGRSYDLLLFGAFLVWGAIDFAASRRRDRQAGAVIPVGTLAGDAKVLATGVAAWLLFALVLHSWLIVVSPFR